MDFLHWVSVHISNGLITGESNFDERNIQLIRGWFLKKQLFKKSMLGPSGAKGGFKSEETGGFFHCQNKYSKSLSRPEYNRWSTP